MYQNFSTQGLHFRVPPMLNLFQSCIQMSASGSDNTIILCRCLNGSFLGPTPFVCRWYRWWAPNCTWRLWLFCCPLFLFRKAAVAQSYSQERLSVDTVCVAACECVYVCRIMLGLGLARWGRLERGLSSSHTLLLCAKKYLQDQRTRPSPILLIETIHLRISRRQRGEKRYLSASFVPFFKEPKIRRIWESLYQVYTVTIFKSSVGCCASGPRHGRRESAA